MRIAFIGDTHYCIPRAHAAPRQGLGTLPDHLRYTPMASALLSPLLDRVREIEPDLLISSGDVVEGGFHGDAPAARREMSEALALFTGLDIPFLISRGTHDAPELFAGLALAAMSRPVGGTITTTYLRHDVGECSFLVLDYQRYAVGNPQDRWLEAELAAATGSGRRVFVVAHAPVFLWGRHFFGDPPLMERLDSLFASYPIEAYLCGHTHNQAVSFHSRQGELGWLQLMASSVGYPAMAPRPLETVHCLADFGADNAYLWGIAEDSAPGLFVIDLHAGGMEVVWESVAGERRRFSVAERRAMPSCLGAPEQRPCSPTAEDFLQIKSAVLGVFGYGPVSPVGQVWVNGVALGRLPVNGSYATRRFLPLSAEAVATVDQHNTIRVRTPSCAEFAIGSVSLEVALLDGRTLRSSVAPEILVAGERWARFPGTRRLVPCSPGEERDLTVTLGSVHPVPGSA